MASTNLTAIGYDLETVPGTTNATPDFQLLPVTSNSLISNISTAVSEVIRSDRQTDDLVIVDADISGDMGFELSYDPYKPLLISLLQGDGTGTTIAAEASVTADGSDDTFAATGVGSDRAVGDVIYATSATDATINGTYVVTVSSADSITVTPSFPEKTGGGDADQTDVAIRAAVVHSNGAEVPNSYTFRTKYENDLGTEFYFYHKGCQISSASLNFSTGSILGGSISVIGLSEIATTTAISGETLVAIPSYTIMNSVTSIGAVAIGGVTVGTCKFNSLDLTVDNNINSAKSIGTLGACSLTSYALQVTGNMEIYFHNLDAYTIFKAANGFTVSFGLVDNDPVTNPTTTNMMGVAMKNCKFESLSHPVSGKDAFLMESGSFRALRDDTSDSMIELTFSDNA